MTCPFLREAQVKFCQAATVRKLIPLAESPTRPPAEEKCSSADYPECRVFQQQPCEGLSAGPCPFLSESLMQYCSAASITKFVPYSESLLGRCGSDSFRYCELYLAMAHPERAGVEDVDGIPVPQWLRYSSNHMWLDVTQDGGCHVGIDAFLSRALGPVERVSYIWLKGHHRAAAILTAGGIDWEVVFPNAFLLTACNLYLRANPSRLGTSPYTSGWLFEGVAEPETAQSLVEGEAARAWMEQEERRMNEFLQQQSGTSLSADGGLFAPALPGRMDRDQAVALFHEFFSPYASGKRES
jgi:glycine cleavage system H lipoate-binding protein